MTWKTVRYNGEVFAKYQCNRNGEIRNRTTKQIRTHQTNGRTGRKFVQLWDAKEGRKHMLFVHRIMASTFKREPKPGEELLHINENAADNRNRNIKWGTKTENMNRHYKATGRRSKTAPHLSPAAFEIFRKLAAAGFSQIKIAAATGVDNATVSRALRGRVKPIGVRDITVDWAVLGCEPLF